RHLDELRRGLRERRGAVGDRLDQDGVRVVAVTALAHANEVRLVELGRRAGGLGGGGDAGVLGEGIAARPRVAGGAGAGGEVGGAGVSGPPGSIASAST